ncbi:hypothetical protein DsansV1_C07g0074391 [Dioscorea sansibarensis]
MIKPPVFTSTQSTFIYSTERFEHLLILTTDCRVDHSDLSIHRYGSRTYRVLVHTTYCSKCLVIVVGLYYGFLTTFSIGPSYLFLLRARVNFFPSSSLIHTIYIHRYRYTLIVEIIQKPIQVQVAMDSTQRSRPIVAPQYCLAHPTDLAFTTKVDGVKHGKLSVTDINGNILFWLDASAWKTKRKLIDAATGITLLSINQKFWSAHDKWKAFMGDSTNEKDLLFTVKRSSALQFRTNLEVFLATNTNKNECDFRIKGEFRKKSNEIYKGNTSMVVAQMNKEHKVVKVPLGKHAFGVSIVENMDIAFIVGLVVVLHELYEKETMVAVSSGTSAGIAASC